MDWKDIEALIEEQQKLVMNVTMEAAQFSPTDLSEAIAPLMDGTVDDGDEEQISEAMLDLILDMPSYRQLLQFTINKHDSFKKLYAFLAQSSAEDLAKFLEVTHSVAGKLGAAKMVESFLAAGIAVDKRTA